MLDDARLDANIVAVSKLGNVNGSNNAVFHFLQYNRPPEVIVHDNSVVATDGRVLQVASDYCTNWDIHTYDYTELFDSRIAGLRSGGLQVQAKNIGSVTLGITRKLVWWLEREILKLSLDFFFKLHRASEI